MSAIEWTDVTWNPVRGCSIVSKGCTNCYAMKQAHRFSGPGGPYEGLTTLTNGGPVWTGDARLVPELLDAPLKRKKPRRVFVNSMSDLFHEDVPDAFIDQVFGVMAITTRHTYQILTKRSARMRDYIRSRTEMAMDEQCRKAGQLMGAPDCISDASVAARRRTNDRGYDNCGPLWPLENVWLGVSVEDQAAADERIPLLLETPAAVRFVSAEPLLGPVDFTSVEWPEKRGHRVDVLRAGYWNAEGWRYGGPSAALGAPRGLFTNHSDMSRIDWVIVGGESGPGARPCDVAWIRSIVEQCKAASVPVFCKQLGALPYNSGGDVKPGDELIASIVCRVALTDGKGGDPSEWPADLRVREMPA